MARIIMRQASVNQNTRFLGYLILSDFTEIWTKVITYSLQDKAFNLSKVLIQLIALEASLQWKGFLRKTPTFINNPRLKDLRKLIPILKVANRLVNSLNATPQLLQLINIIKPSVVEVKLTDTLSLTIHPDMIKKSRQKLFLDYLRDPNEIAWEIDVFTKSSYIYQSRNMATYLFEVFYLLAKNIIEVSKSQILSMK